MPSTDITKLHQAEVEVIDPLTGDLVDCSDPQTAAAFIEGMRQFKTVADRAIKEATGQIAEEMGRQGKNKLVLDRFEATRAADRVTTWDGVEEMLDELIVAGLPEEAQLELVETVVTRKVNATVANRLARANPAYEAIIDKHRTVEDRGWKVTTKPRAPK